MAAKNFSSASGVVLILLLLITFPFWIAILAAVGGILAGVFGAVFGIIGSVLGAMGSIIAWPFKMLFGHWHWFPHFHLNGFVIVAILLVVALIARQKSKSA